MAIKIQPKNNVKNQDDNLAYNLYMQEYNKKRQKLGADAEPKTRHIPELTMSIKVPA